MGEILPFLPKNGGEKWPRKNIFEIPPFSSNSLYFIERRTFAQNYKFINKNDHGGIGYR